MAGDMPKIELYGATRLGQEPRASLGQVIPGAPVASVWGRQVGVGEVVSVELHYAGDPYRVRVSEDQEVKAIHDRGSQPKMFNTTAAQLYIRAIEALDRAKAAVEAALAAERSRNRLGKGRQNSDSSGQMD